MIIGKCHWCGQVEVTTYDGPGCVNIDCPRCVLSTENRIKHRELEQKRTQELIDMFVKPTKETKKYKPIHKTGTWAYPLDEYQRYGDRTWIELTPEDTIEINRSYLGEVSGYELAYKDKYHFDCSFEVFWKMFEEVK